MLELLISTKAYNAISEGKSYKINPLLSKSEFDILKSSCRRNSDVFVISLSNSNRIRVSQTSLNPINPDFSNPKKSSQFFKVGPKSCWQNSFDN